MENIIISLEKHKIFILSTFNNTKLTKLKINIQKHKILLFGDKIRFIKKVIIY